MTTGIDGPGSSTGLVYGDLSIVQLGADVQISDGSNTILLKNTVAADIDATDFIV